MASRDVFRKHFEETTAKGAELDAELTTIDKALAGLADRHTNRVQDFDKEQSSLKDRCRKEQAALCALRDGMLEELRRSEESMEIVAGRISMSTFQHI